MVVNNLGEYGINLFKVLNTTKNLMTKLEEW